MIVGIGNDIIEADRIKKACERRAFFLRVFTENERKLIEKHPKAAGGNWCVKEAVVKCFGTGFAGCSPKEIEVLRDDNGRPFVNLYGKAKEISEKMKIIAIHVSISDIKNIVSAVAVCEGRDEL